MKIRTDLKKQITHRYHQAFTLVELLLVLVILGILAAIVIPKFSGRTKQAQIAATQTQIANFKTAINAFEVDTGSYPKSLLDLIVQPRDIQNWHGPYLQSATVPKHPWQHDYIYKFPGSHNPSSYDLNSMGPPGEDMIIANWTTQK